jgi:hypothetical protein
MTTPSTTISISDVATELSVSSSGLSLNDTKVRRLAGKVSGAVSLNDLRNKTWVTNLTGRQSTADCYSAQSGFSVDRYGSNGDITLTMGAWPSDPPNCQTCNWEWLKFGGTENATRVSNNTRPYWTNVWTLNISSLSVGQSTTTRAPNWPYTNVAWTYTVTRTATNTITVAIWNSGIGTGDTGTQISINNWYNTFVSTFGGETLTLTWTDLGY